MLEFTPMTEDEIINEKRKADEARLLQAGTYPFEVMDAKEMNSRAGDPMIKLVLKVWDDAGREHTVFDYLLFVGNFKFKMRHFFEGTGAIDKFNSGRISDLDCLNKSGKCEIISQKDKSGKYPDSNWVKDYVKVPSEIVKPTSDIDSLLNDDIPY